MGFSAVVAVLFFSTPGRAQPSALGEWSAVRPWPISAVHTHLLPTGEVFFFGEFEHGPELYLWNPGTDALTRLADAPYNLFCAGHSFLPDGRLLLTGGHIENDRGLADASLFDPWARTLTRLPDMNAGRWYPSNTSLANGEQLVVAGAEEDGTDNPLPQVWSPSSNSWRNLPGAERMLPYYPWTFLAPGGRVFIAGPAATSGWIDPAGAGAYLAGPRSRFGSKRSYGSAVMYRPGLVMISGGGSPPTNTVEVIDLTTASPAFRQVAAMRFVRKQHNAVLLPDGTTLVVGGHYGADNDDPNSPVYETELWSPATESWTTLAPISAFRGYHSTALLLPDGRVLSAGGREGGDMQVYSPPYLSRGARPAISSAPAAIGYGGTFAVGTPQPASVARVTLLRLGSVTHAFDMNQRFVELAFTRGADALTVGSPTAPDEVPPGHYLLFLLSSEGVPSVAAILRIGGSAPPPPPPPPPPGPPEQVVIPFGSSWRYHAGNQDLGAAWTALGYDDGGWRSGPAQLGYGDGDERTVITRTSPTQPSIYFRRTLALTAAPEQVSVRIRKDDGVALWVNGTQVYAHRVGSTAFSAYATSSSENEETTMTLPASAFRAGDNQLAVLVKQRSGSSSDLSFDLELTMAVASDPNHVSLMLTSPNGGESLRVGSTHAITWMTHGGTAETVSLEYSVDAGASWRSIAASVPNTGSFAWSVPAVQTTQALVRVCHCVAGMEPHQDVSDGPFTLTSASTWIAVAPGEYWRFEDSGADPGPGWAQRAFDDSGWRLGPAELGYGDGDEQTQLLRTSPAQPTVYFRKKLTLTETLSEAALRVRHDDGVVVWINGREAFSRYVSDTTHGAYADDTSAENEVSSAPLDAGLFVVGENQLAVAIKQSSGGSSDVSFDLELTVTSGAAPPPPPPPGAVVNAFPFGAEWRYHDGGVDLGPGWVATSYADGAWPLGRAQLGYGDGDEATRLTRRTPTQPSYYFRRHFSAERAPSDASVTVRFDDGFAVWINGTQVAARNVSDTSYPAFATSSSSDNAQVTVDVPASAIRAGDNVIAVIVKQRSADSSDVSFDLKLDLEVPAP